MATHISTSKLVELVQAAGRGGQMYASVVGGVIALGADPTNPTVAIDLAVEAIVPFRRDPQPTSRTVRLARKSGDYWMELRGSRQEFGSLRDLLAEGLRALERVSPGTLDQLSRIKPRSKRIVAQDKELLFDMPEQVNKYASQLQNGWWYGTNNSKDETKTWLKRACECAKLVWDRDFRTNI